MATNEPPSLHAWCFWKKTTFCRVQNFRLPIGKSSCSTSPQAKSTETRLPAVCANCSNGPASADLPLVTQACPERESNGPPAGQAIALCDGWSLVTSSNASRLSLANHPKPAE